MAETTPNATAIPNATNTAQPSAQTPVQAKIAQMQAQAVASASPQAQATEKARLQASASSGNLNAQAQMAAMQPAKTTSTGVRVQSYQTVAPKTGQGVSATGQSYQIATTTAEGIRKNAISEVARLNSISEAEATKRYDNAISGQAGQSGTVYNPATGLTTDPRTGSVVSGYDAQKNPIFSPMEKESIDSVLSGKGDSTVLSTEDYEATSQILGDKIAKGEASLTDLASLNTDQYMSQLPPEIQTINKRIKEYEKMQSIDYSTLAFDPQQGYFNTTTGEKYDSKLLDPSYRMIATLQNHLDTMLNEDITPIHEQYKTMVEDQIALNKDVLGKAKAAENAAGHIGSMLADGYIQATIQSNERALRDIATRERQALTEAKRNYMEGDMQLAWKQLEIVDTKRQEYNQLVTQQFEMKETYFKRLQDTQVFYAQMQQYEDQKADRAEIKAANSMGKLIDAGYEYNDVTESYFKDFEQRMGMPEGYAKAYWDTTQASNKASKAKTASESRKAEIDAANSLITLADKMGTGVEIPIGDTTYTYQGTNIDNIVSGTETDASGNVIYWQYNQKTGETVNYKLGITKKEDGWQTINLGEKGVWAVNALTGESKPFYASEGQQSWDQGNYKTGEVGPALPGSKNTGQCGAMSNYFYGKGVVGDSLQSKLDPLSEYQVTNVNEVRAGMSFVQNIGTYGHIGFIEDVGVDPNGKAYFTAFESNYKGDGKIGHGRKMYFDDPTLEMISDYPAPKLSGVGSDSKPSNNVLGNGQESAKPLSASEIKTYTDLGYSVEPGMTLEDIRGMKKTIGGESLALPSYEQFTNEMQNTLGQSIVPEKMQEMYKMTVGKIQPISDATEVITANMTAAQSKATTSAINKALERGDIIGAREQVKSAAIAALPTAEQTKVRGREVGIEQLQNIQGLLQDYKMAGGDTSVISGTVEEMASKIGKVSDPERRKMASQIRTALIDYRQSVSGAAFTESEMEEYKGLFPSIGASYDLNQARIDGLVRAWKGSNESTFRSIMTPSLYEQIWH